MRLSRAHPSRLPANRRARVVEPVLLKPASMSADIVIGRTLACCVHPSAAWRRLSASGRALIVGTYFFVSYVAVLAVLFAK
jgi:hypothetical protein